MPGAGSAPTPTAQEHRAPALAAVPAAQPAHAPGGAVAALHQALGNRSFTQVLGRAPLGIQRDLGAKQKVGEAVDRPDPDTKGDGFSEAFRILNGLAMFDMLATLLALNRSGHLPKLDANWKWAVGVNTPRLQLAFAAVKAKGVTDAEAFVRVHGPAMMGYPLDQRQDIIRFLEPTWFDDLKATEEGDALIAAIRAHAEFTTLDAESKTLTEEIFTESRAKREQFVYYMTKLKLLFDTPRKDPAKTGEETRARTDEASKAEAKRLASPRAARNTGLEERKSAAKGRVWTAVPGTYGGTWYIDKRDPTDIVVKASVYLEPKGGGKAADVTKIKAMEDGIEKAASSPGYLVDLTFLRAPAPGCFMVGVNTDEWEVADNWSGGDPAGFAHELHHLMKFELDRYDYVEAHAQNTDMDIPTRLYWFRKELSKPPNYNDPTSIMHSNGHPNHDDVCRVAELDLATCVARRQKAAAGKP